MLLVTFFRATVSLLPTKPIDRAPACEGNTPAEQLAGFRGIVIGLVPNLQQDVLQHIVGVAFLVDDVADDRFESATVSRIEFVQCFRSMVGYGFHECFIRYRRPTAVL